MVSGFERRIRVIEHSLGSTGLQFVVVVSGVSPLKDQVDEWLSARGIERRPSDKIIAVDTGIER